jgi:hypothetical protein
MVRALMISGVLGIVYFICSAVVHPHKITPYLLCQQQSKLFVDYFKGGVLGLGQVDHVALYPVYSPPSLTSGLGNGSY